MKKEYRTPAMKVREIHCSHMLCGSGDGCFRITNGPANPDEVAWSKEECEDGDFGW